jgi:hypothetical protein
MFSIRRIRVTNTYRKGANPQQLAAREKVIPWEELSECRRREMCAQPNLRSESPPLSYKADHRP